MQTRLLLLAHITVALSAIIIFHYMLVIDMSAWWGRYVGYTGGQLLHMSSDIDSPHSIVSTSLFYILPVLACVLCTTKWYLRLAISLSMFIPVAILYSNLTFPPQELGSGIYLYCTCAIIMAILAIVSYISKYYPIFDTGK